MIQLPQLQEALLVASDGMVARSRRRAQRFRLGLMTTAAVVTVGGGAVASQGLWAPAVGLDADRRPSVSAAPAPESQQQALSVLRRPQVAADRSEAPQLALQLVSRQYRDVRVGSVRLLGTSDPGVSAVLVPVGQVAARSQASRSGTVDNALCVVVVDEAEAAGPRCFREDELRDGRATAVNGGQVIGVVPDGVTAVRFTVPGGKSFDLPVRSNLFSADPTRVRAGTTIAWRRANGKSAPFSGGGATRALAVPVPVPVSGLSPNAEQQDCGTDGGIVPRTVPCGPESRAYAERAGASDEPRVPKPGIAIRSSGRDD